MFRRGSIAPHSLPMVSPCEPAKYKLPYSEIRIYKSNDIIKFKCEKCVQPRPHGWDRSFFLHERLPPCCVSQHQSRDADIVVVVVCCRGTPPFCEVFLGSNQRK